MTTTLLLAGLLLATLLLGIALVAPRTLAGAAWTRRTPVGGIVAWQSLIVTVPLGMLAACVALAMPLAAPSSAIAEAWGVPRDVLATHYATPGGLFVSAAACLAGLTLLGRLVVVGFAEARRLRSTRAAHRDGLRHVATPTPGGYSLVRHPSPLVYCVPGRRPVVVVTSGARRLLGPEALDLVLQHERAHLRARHACVLAWAEIAARAVPLPVLRVARDELSVLVEMQADDAASDRRGLARALVSLGCSAPPASLAAGDIAAVDRVRRLVRTESRTRIGRLGEVGAAALSATILLATPTLLAASPLIEMLLTDCVTPLG